MDTTLWRRGIAIASLSALALFGAACGDDEEEADAGAEGEAEGGESAAGGEPTGPGCAAVPTDAADEGSFSGMSDDPVGTAASNNPALTTLVTAVTEAALVDTLNDTAQMYTVFAPVNDAFAKIPEADLTAVLADKAVLTSILTLHVVPGMRLDAEALMGMESVATVNGQEITLAAEGETLMVNGQASVICANIQTANATVHLIDTVMMPAAA